MKRFKNILLIADRRTWAENILNRAVTLAKNNQAHLTVVEIFKKLSNDMQTVLATRQLSDIQEAVARDRREQLNNLIKPVKEKGVSVSIKVLIGTPFLEIIRQVLRNNHDLVITTAAGEGGVKEMLFGTTTMHLMRKCPCPVWVIKSAQTARFSSILAAVDPAPSDAERNRLNIKIMELASSLTRLEKSELHVVHVWEAHDEYLYSRRVPSDMTDIVVKDLQNMHKDWLLELLKQCKVDIPENQIHLLKGEAGKVIQELAEELQVELIVMGTVARTGISGVYMGNTAEKVLHQVDCSVLAVKPEDFLTPVSL